MKRMLVMLITVLMMFVIMPAQAALAEGYVSDNGSDDTAVVTKAPTAKPLIYTGSAQELVTAGEAAGGTMQYALGTENEATEPYTAAIPEATDAGDYYVWYRVLGDADHTDSKPDCVNTEIDKAQPEIIAAPIPKTDLVYNGDYQELVIPGEANGGVIFYYASTDDEPHRKGMIESAMGVDAGDYNVWYWISGDENHYPTDQYNPLKLDEKVTISRKTVTVKALDQTIKEGESIQTGVDQAALTDAATGHILGEVTLKENGNKIEASNAAIVVASNTESDETENYNIIYQPGTLTIRAKSSQTATSKVVIKSARAKKGRKAQIVWKKLSGISGCQIAYSTSKKFTKKTTVKVTTGNTSNKKVLRKLKAGKKYYVKVRSYTIVHNPSTGTDEKSYGKWSNVKTFKARK